MARIVISISFGLEKNPGFHLTIPLLRRLIYAMMYGDLIMNVANQVRPYEVNAGNVGRNADELLRKVQACQFVAEHGDEVCPAKWQPGAETLKPSLDLVGQL